MSVMKIDLMAHH